MSAIACYTKKQLCLFMHFFILKSTDQEYFCVNFPVSAETSIVLWLVNARSVQRIFFISLNKYEFFCFGGKMADFIFCRYYLPFTKCLLKLSSIKIHVPLRSGIMELTAVYRQRWIIIYFSKGKYSDHAQIIEYVNRKRHISLVGNNLSASALGEDWRVRLGDQCTIILEGLYALGSSIICRLIKG